MDEKGCRNFCGSLFESCIAALSAILQEFFGKFKKILEMAQGRFKK